MKKALILTAFSFSSFAMANNCIEPKVFIDYPSDMSTGRYYRFSPEGDKVIVSGGRVNDKGNTVGVIKINKSSDGKFMTESIPTKMANEAYPVEGMKNNKGDYEWSIVASPYDRDGGNQSMKYYQMDGENGVEKKGMDSGAIFSDDQHDQYYHSAGTHKNDGNKSKFKVMLWSNQKIKEFESVTKPDGTKEIKALTGTYHPCPNIDRMSGPIISKDAKYVSFTGTSNGRSSTVIYEMLDEGLLEVATEPVRNETKKERRKRLKREKKNKTASASPAVAPTGRNCRVVSELGYSTSKVSFAYPDQEPLVGFHKSAQYEVDGQLNRREAIYVYNYGDPEITEENRTRLISDPKTEKAQGYPGMLADGRVMYMAKVIKTDADGFTEVQNKIVIADPGQINSDGSINTNPTKCIEKKLTASSGGNSGSSEGSTESSTTQE